jgi:hypothetical protein
MGIPHPVITDVTSDLMNHTLKLVLNDFGGQISCEMHYFYAFCVFTASS